MQGRRAISALDLSGLLNSPENSTSLPRTGSNTRPASPDSTSQNTHTTHTLASLDVSSLLSPSSPSTNIYAHSTPSSSSLHFTTTTVQSPVTSTTSDRYHRHHYHPAQLRQHREIELQYIQPSNTPSDLPASVSLLSTTLRRGRASSMAAVATQAPPTSNPAMEETTQQSADRPADLPRPYKCPMCPKAFHRLEHQTRHIRTHTGEKPHACQFPGCTKRFSRSDELTRHSRIHNNPNSRRNNKAHHAFVQPPGGPMPGYATAQQDGGIMMPPPPPQVTRSAPQSQISSPNVSPPHNFTYAQPAYASVPNAGSPTGVMPPSNPSNISLLATAASQVERDDALQQAHGHARHHPAAPAVQGHPHIQYAAAYPSRHSSTSLSAYALSNSHSTNSTAANSPLHSRSHSPTRHFETPLSTAPSSPTWSHNSISPTPDHTPLATPAHSPRLRPYGIPAHLSNNGGGGSSSSLSALNEQQQQQQQHYLGGGGSGVHLPSLRQLSLGQPATTQPAQVGPISHQPAAYGMPAPMLAPMEPSVSSNGAYLSPAGSGNNTPFGSLGNGGHLADIMSRARGEERKLPVPRVASGDMQPFIQNKGDAMEI